MMTMSTATLLLISGEIACYHNKLDYREWKIMGGTSQAIKKKKEKSKMKMKRGENRIILAHISTSTDMPSELPILPSIMRSRKRQLEL